jgi:hypothetical protein
MDMMLGANRNAPAGPMACAVMEAACPLCGGLETEICALCGARLCAVHDAAHRMSGEAVCHTCWREF